MPTQSSLVPTSAECLGFPVVASIALGNFDGLLFICLGYVVDIAILDEAENATLFIALCVAEYRLNP
jgi:hypothetical protein